MNGTWLQRRGAEAGGRGGGGGGGAAGRNPRRGTGSSEYEHDSRSKFVQRLVLRVYEYRYDSSEVTFKGDERPGQFGWERD